MKWSSFTKFERFLGRVNAACLNVNLIVSDGYIILLRVAVQKLPVQVSDGAFSDSDFLYQP